MSSIFQSLVDNIEKKPNESNLSELVAFVESNIIGNEDIAYLAKTLANSGSVIKIQGKTSDIPSTGGPSSLSTLICPLLLSEYGYKVVKLGVSGRPAGGIDVLAQIPNYQIEFNKRQIESFLLRNSYIHFIANDDFAPLDKILFNYRKRYGKIDIAPLVVASLLSKKIACGLNQTGLDIRVSRFGNFGKTFQEAKQNAQRFKDVGELIGISVKCFISDSNYAYQPFIGRGESLVALYKVFGNDLESEPLLKQHLDYCLLMASSLSELEIPENIHGILHKNFIQNLCMQGSSEESFIMKIDEIKNRECVPIVAKNKGFVNYDLEVIRKTMVGIQNKFVTPKNPFPDPVGVVLLKGYGSHVYEGEHLALLRFDSKLVDNKMAISAFQNVVGTTSSLNEGRNFIIENYGR